MLVLDIQTTARELLGAYDHGRLVPTPTERNPVFDWNAAYEVAAEIVKLRRARGERCAGRKIGFTNRNIWAEYGATSPIWAHVYDSTLVFAENNHATLSLSGSVAPRLEPEIAFKLRGPVPVGCRDPATILQSIEWLAPSFEIVDCHFADWRFKSADSAADQSLHWRLIVGTPYAIKAAEIAKLAAQIHDCRVVLKCNGEIRDRGVGSNALDHPALALAFLADILATQPKFDALAAGEIVTTGTLTAALSVKTGETWTSEFSGLALGPLTLTFGA
jgi:2-oxo-3-hexenedioate decarboxylase